tara:strand:- start:5724 stop:5993 length:270 start_codon:yes stop_codon:yes gene_type:complete
MIPYNFRGRKIPAYIKSKTQLVAWVLTEFMNDEPISNWEFVAELHCHRFGGIIHNLRQEGYEITTLPSKKRGLVHYFCTKLPATTAAIS